MAILLLLATFSASSHSAPNFHRIETEALMQLKSKRIGQGTKGEGEERGGADNAGGKQEGEGEQGGVDKVGGKQEGKYEKIGSRENCGSGKEVATESECEKAAGDLGMPFHAGNWRGAQRYCFVFENNVFFNKNTSKAPSSMRHVDLRAICEKDDRPRDDGGTLRAGKEGGGVDEVVGKQEDEGEQGGEDEVGGKQEGEGGQGGGDEAGDKQEGEGEERGSKQDGNGPVATVGNPNCASWSLHWSCITNV